jgi:hypothetical protein
MEIKTSELHGTALDWAVAKCEGFDEYLENYLPLCYADADGRNVAWNPSTDWSQGGPIIEREGIALQMHFGDWIALPYDSVFSEEAYQQGTRPLVAAMRCYVASKLGDEVEVPEGLCLVIGG